MPTKRLPAKPDLQHLKHQARDLLNEQREGTLAVCQRIREFHPRFAQASDTAIAGAPFNLSDALLTIAREYGFASWARLKSHVAQRDTKSRDLPHHERIKDAVFRQAVELLDDGATDALREHLSKYPALIRQRVEFEGGNYFRNPTLLQFVAENPVRHDALPPNIVEIAQLILEAGAKNDRGSIDETLGLVCSGRVPRECGVQIPLIELLCKYGAEPNGAMLPALVHGEFEAVEALIQHGANVDLVAAAATGRTDAARQQLQRADAAQRHGALSLAAQFGHTDIVRLLLDHGEDPNRYNPVHHHAHSTPLHQAALAGHTEVVRLLVERGARLDTRDLLHDGTPADWAEYAGQRELADFLRRRS